MKTFEATPLFIDKGGIQALESKGFAIKELESDKKIQRFSFEHPDFAHGKDGFYQFIINQSKGLKDSVNVRFIGHKESRMVYDADNGFSEMTRDEYIKKVISEHE